MGLIYNTNIYNYNTPPKIREYISKISSLQLNWLKRSIDKLFVITYIK